MPSELFWLPEPRLVADAPLLHGVDDGAEHIAELAPKNFLYSIPDAFVAAENMVPEGYIARCFVVLGHCRGDYPSPKPRKGGRYLITEKENG